MLLGSPSWRYGGSPPSVMRWRWCSSRLLGPHWWQGGRSKQATMGWWAVCREDEREQGREGGGQRKGKRKYHNVVRLTEHILWLTVCVASCTMAQGSSSTVTTNVERACKRFAPMATAKQQVKLCKWMRGGWSGGLLLTSQLY